MSSHPKMHSIPASSITSWRVKPLTQKSVKPRQRAFRPKSRGGCITCKARRVKCTEERPYCARCVKGGFPCEGYAPAKTWLFEPSKSPAETTSEDRPSPPSSGTELTLSPSWTDSVGTDERRALSYWMERAQPELATFAFAAAHLWTNLVPQLYQTNSTVRSAIIASAVLHEDTRIHGITSQRATRNQLYLKHYFRAVQDLTRTDSLPSQEVILMSCLIFMACENLRESAPGVILHLKAGLKVLREIRQPQLANSKSITADSAADMLSNLVEPIFARLEAQATMIPFVASDSLTDFTDYDLYWRRPAIPTKYNDFFEARNAMHDIVQHMWYSAKQLEGLLGEATITSGVNAYRDFLYNMTAWDVIFTKSFPRHADPAYKYHLQCLGLRLHQKALIIAFKSESSNDPLWLDKHESEVAHLLDTAEAIITAGKPPKARHDEYGFSNLWDYDFCINPPLLLFSVFCRHPILRRKALHLMRLHHCWWSERENYHACAIARMCELTMEVEERGLPSPVSSTAPTPSSTPSINENPAPHIPPSSRIRIHRAILDRPHKIVIEYARPYSPDHDPNELHLAEAHWSLWTPPPLPFVKMYPFAELVKHGNSLGMIRPMRSHCLCKSLGTPVKGMWENPA